MAEFTWNGFVDSVAAWIATFGLTGDGFEDGYVVGKNLAAVETGADVEGLDAARPAPILLTVFDETGTVPLSHGSLQPQGRVVRLTRRGGSSKVAVTRLGEVFQEIVRRRRFADLAFVGTLRNVIRTPTVLIRNPDNTVHAETILEFAAFSRGGRPVPA